MNPNTGYIITEQNAQLICNISGFRMQTLLRNIGWVVIYREGPYPDWSLLPLNVASRVEGFHLVDSPLNGLPARSVKEIRAEWAEVNTTYSAKLEELQKELKRAGLQEAGVNDVNDDKAQVSISDATTARG